MKHSAPNDEQLHHVALASLADLGPRRLDRLLADTADGSAMLAWALLASGKVDSTRIGVDPDLAARWSRHARALDLDQLRAHVVKSGMEVVDQSSDSWPEQLRNDPEPPRLLFGRGPLGPVTPSVAIVGTRRCTQYGRRVARQLASDLGARGIGVVSGLALGIDAEAQRAALDQAGPVIGVVGSGLDVIYPKANHRLWRDIGTVGRLWSECAPGVKPARWRFPARNRLVVALADVVVVVESHVKGGSLHTVDAAIDRDVPVLVVPGPIDSSPSVGTNRLLIQGCAPCTGIDDVLVALGLVDESAVSRAARATLASKRVAVSPAAQKIVDALGPNAASTSELSLRCGLDVGSVVFAVNELVDAGVVRDVSGWVEAIR